MLCTSESSSVQSTSNERPERRVHNMEHRHATAQWLPQIFIYNIYTRSGIMGSRHQQGAVVQGGEPPLAYNANICEVDIRRIRTVRSMCAAPNAVYIYLVYLVYLYYLLYIHILPTRYRRVVVVMDWGKAKHPQHSRLVSADAAAASSVVQKTRTHTQFAQHHLAVCVRARGRWCCRPHTMHQLRVVAFASRAMRTNCGQHRGGEFRYSLVQRRQRRGRGGRRRCRGRELYSIVGVRFQTRRS